MDHQEKAYWLSRANMDVHEDQKWVILYFRKLNSNG